MIPRDRHAMFFATLGVVASSIERLAIEVRHLQRTEVLEAEEFFSEGQKGSSAMPHKRNPVLSENLTGLARMVRAYVTPALENVALWHERDISHSSVERMIGPDATVTLDFALARLTGLIDKLLVYPENMQKNLDRLGGLIHSQRVLLALTQKGASREEAYAAGAAQRHAGLARRRRFPQPAQGRQGREDSTSAMPRSKRTSTSAIHLKHVDTIFRRVFGASSALGCEPALSDRPRRTRRTGAAAERAAAPPPALSAAAPPATPPAAPAPTCGLTARRRALAIRRCADQTAPPDRRTGAPCRRPACPAGRPLSDRRLASVRCRLPVHRGGLARCRPGCHSSWRQPAWPRETAGLHRS